MVYDFDEPFPDNWSFTLFTAIPKEGILHMIHTLQYTMEMQITKNPNVFVKALMDQREDLVLFLHSMFSANTLYINSLVENLEEIRFGLSKLMLTICSFNPEDAELSLSDDDVQEFLSIWIYLTEKMCYLSDKYMIFTLGKT
jgi:hypothetical protein